ncbi:MAG: peptidase M13 [Opitutus sp.]|nr:peptidase M13 [Opitutus sp.]
MRSRKALFVLAAGALALCARAEINPATFDRSVKPQDDFNLFVNGTWLKNTQIPADAARWGAFDELRERNWQALHTLAERVATKGATAAEIERLVGDYYASGMDETAINAAGVTPLEPAFARIAAAQTPAEIFSTIAFLHSRGLRAAFNAGVSADAKDSNSQIFQMRQGGFALPGAGRDADRDYYFNTDERSQKIRAEYVKHIAKMLELSGWDAAAAQAGAEGAMRIETALAGVSLPRGALRNPYASYNRIPVADLAAKAPGVDWAGYFQTVGLGEFKELNLAHPKFFAGFASLVNEAPATDWQSYLRWRVVSSLAPFLTTAIEEENFRFYSGVIAGVQERKPRWRRVLAATDAGIGEALGQLYVAEYFPPEAKTRVLKLVEDLRSALGDRLRALEWMDETTKEKALAKLAAFTVKMGYPDKWEDYSSLKLDRASYVVNQMRISEFEQRKNVARLGQPTDKAEWGMTPPTVNASYSSTSNAITFPAGILQPPFFDAKADDAVNYGGIGAVIGHEMTHGFDDSGRRYDHAGNLTDWWTKESSEEFNKRAAKIVAQFSAYPVLDGTLYLKGELTQGENIADLGGVKVSFLALQKALEGKPREKIDGWTPEQRFFLSYASIWRDLQRPEEQRRRVNVDPHSPGKWRIKGPLSNLDEFFAAFDVKEGDPMRRPADQRFTIW